MSLMMTAIILVDQFTKGAVQSNFYHGESIPIIEGFFNFTYVRNPGAAFGMGANAHDTLRAIFFLALPVLACFWLIWLIWTTRKTSLLLCTAYSLIFAGAVGNLIDRFTLNYVVDFLDFHFKGNHFPAFNVADSAISIAAGLLIIDFIKELRKKEDTSNETSAT
tara:strand:- start:9194 stop:9685 length:492 start_codon:yes stop_codon:yes gene_type:complete